MKKIYEIIINALLTTTDYGDHYIDHVEDVAWGLYSIYTRNAYQPSEEAYNYLDKSIMFELTALNIIDSDIHELLTYATLKTHIRHLEAISDDYDALHAYILYNDLNDYFRDDTILLINSDIYHSNWCNYTPDVFFKDYEDYRTFTDVLNAEDIAGLKKVVYNA